ncbi:uncharacterized protein N0V89_007222 [Didymosphaeria variabile]|uniref:Heterokaryon incompatibility domain-containing protein n=1 Tax=Didymosphaeria variabile TaxID=1932322 RepID=A0A9W9CA15_9PLEO|nr:uncharacterized protein N0V89_007222 [Didymosphaeria variabile]KAJ4351878.1 hypothetical protein N0V89_007222 [Didymosphaeria variabile]
MASCTDEKIEEDQTKREVASETLPDAIPSQGLEDELRNLQEEQLGSLLLVDVVSGNLVTLPIATKFVALSYVWGNVATLKSGKDNIDELEQQGALFNEPYKSALPHTIRDAMHVVQASGEQYLWVDCLSIVQDSGKEEMDKMLKAMARIYASAEFTIVASQGDDADYGIRGVGGPSKQRECNVSERDFEHEGGNGFPWLSRWASRGWTFQETLFSRRLLVFNKEVSWICGRHMRMEHEADSASGLGSAPTVWPSERPHLGVPMGMMSLIPHNPSLGRWGMIVENFASRNLTYEEDISRALAGATEVMSSTFPGGLHKGLPLFFFDIALLWQPRGSLERRNGEPSWSWTGWKGQLECLSSWYPFFPGVYRRSGLSTEWTIIAPLRPLAVWGLSSQGIGNKHLNGFYEYQKMRYDPDRSIPCGWERRTHPEGDYFVNDRYAETGFQYAMPLPSIDSTWEVVDPGLDSILLCTAPTATASLGAMLFPGSSVFAIMHDELYIGSVTLHSVSHETKLSGQHCDLVAISASELANKQDTRNQEYFGHFSALALNLEQDDGSGASIDIKDCEFYNVLCITTNNGIAYRRGLGTVSKRYWDRMGAKVETIKLG